MKEVQGMAFNNDGQYLVASGMSSVKVFKREGNGDLTEVAYLMDPGLLIGSSHSSFVWME
jgi:hypothetical protein